MALIKSKNALLLMAVILMTAALFARDLYGININKIYFVALAVLSALFMDFKSLVYYVFFLLPLTSGLPGNYILPLLIVLLLIKNKNTIKERWVGCFAILVFMEIVHYGFYGFRVSLPSVVGYLADLFLLVYLVSLSNCAVDNKKCLIYFCTGLAVFMVAIFYITQINANVEMLLEDQGRVGHTKYVADVETGTMMLNANPNGLGFFSIVGMSTVIVLYLKREIKLWVMLLFAVIFLYVGLLGVSRTFLFSVVVMFAMLFFLNWQTSGKFSWGRSLLLFFAVILAFYYLYNRAFLYDAYTNRLTAESMGTAGSRTTIFAEYNHYLINNPVYFLLGTGAVHYGQVMDSIPVSIHNGLQQILVAYGIIGLLFFVYITYSAIKMCYKKGNLIFLVPFLTAFLYVQGGQLLNPSHNLYMFIVAFFVMKMSWETNVSVKNNSRLSS